MHLLHEVRSALAQVMEVQVSPRFVVKAIARDIGLTFACAYLRVGDDLV